MLPLSSWNEFFLLGWWGKEYSTRVSWDEINVTENPVCLKGGIFGGFSDAIDTWWLGESQQ